MEYTKKMKDSPYSMLREDDIGKPLYQHIADQCRRARSIAQITQKELASRIGTKQSYVSYIENGKADNVTLDMLRRWSGACGVMIHVHIYPR